MSRRDSLINDVFEILREHFNESMQDEELKEMAEDIYTSGVLFKGDSTYDSVMRYLSDMDEWDDTCEEE